MSTNDERDAEIAALEAALKATQEALRITTAERDHASQSEDIRFVNQGMNELLISHGWVGGLPSIVFTPRPAHVPPGVEGDPVNKGAIPEDQLSPGSTVLRFGTGESFIRLVDRMNMMVEELQQMQEGAEDDA